jgi:neutral ceramidase
MEASSSTAALNIATDRFDVTPDYPVSLLGYFNDRVSTGVIDPLYARLLAVRKGSYRALLVQVDSCLIPTADAEYLRDKISGSTDFEPHQILICTNHTHTAPALTEFFEVKAETRYRRELYEMLLNRVKRLNPDSSCLIRGTHGRAPGLSHNRRWFMRNGMLTTNPARGSADLLRPEGPVDEGVEIIGFFSPGGKLLALIVNVSNHTDTVGGTRISADWTGYLERVLNETLREHFPVLTLIAPQGNINHYEFDRHRDQTSPEEAERIGRAYADVVLSSWGGLRELPVDDISGSTRLVKIQPREVDATALRRARETLALTTRVQELSDLKAEDLQAPEVRRLFARELIDFLESRPPVYDVPLQVLRMGEVLLCAIPGEPFVEIGLELKGGGLEVRDATILPVALANGYFGYIPLESCFDRGGYEVQPGRNNCLSRKAAGIITAELKDMLESIISKRVE